MEQRRRDDAKMWEKGSGAKPLARWHHPPGEPCLLSAAIRLRVFAPSLFSSTAENSADESDALQTLRAVRGEA